MPEPAPEKPKRIKRKKQAPAEAPVEEPSAEETAPVEEPSTDSVTE